MRRLLLALILVILPFAGAQAGMGFLTANDTGGIIAWSPANQRHAREIAAAHCAEYGKLARITSIWPRYGQYIGFACRFPRAYAVRYHRRAHRTVLRVRD
jgi:hypothetical protein